MTYFYLKLAFSQALNSDSSILTSRYEISTSLLDSIVSLLSAPSSSPIVAITSFRMLFPNRLHSYAPRLDRYFFLVHTITVFYICAVYSEGESLTFSRCI